jgi:carboxylesterase type B
MPHLLPTPVDRELSATVRQAWLRFAETGDPNGPGLTPWPQYERATDPYLEIGVPTRPGKAFRKPQLEVLEKFYSR